MPRMSSNAGARVWQSVKVDKEGHPRHGHAGTIQSIPKDDPTTVGVRFDLDSQEVETVNCTDLETL